MVLYSDRFIIFLLLYKYGFHKINYSISLLPPINVCPETYDSSFLNNIRVSLSTNICCIGVNNYRTTETYYQGMANSAAGSFRINTDQVSNIYLNPIKYFHPISSYEYNGPTSYVSSVTKRETTVFTYDGTPVTETCSYSSFYGSIGRLVSNDIYSYTYSFRTYVDSYSAKYTPNTPGYGTSGSYSEINTLLSKSVKYPYCETDSTAMSQIHKYSFEGSFGPGSMDFGLINSKIYPYIFNICGSSIVCPYNIQALASVSTYSYYLSNKQTYSSIFQRFSERIVFTRSSTVSNTRSGYMLSVYYTSTSGTKTATGRIYSLILTKFLATTTVSSITNINI